VAKAKKTAKATHQPAPKPKETLKPKATVKRKGNRRIIKTPAQPGTPATPGVRENQRDPFLSADDIWDIGQEQAGWAAETSDAERARDEAIANLPQTLEDIRRKAMDVREGQSSNAIDRGIFQSSINEMALTDINVAETVSTEAAKSLVTTAQATLDRIKNDIETVRKPALYTRAGARSVENAEAWNADQEWQTPPTEATPGKPATRVVDYDAKTPGIQNRNQARRNAAQRAAQQPTKPGGGRGSQGAQPNRPGGPRKTATVRPVRKPKPKETLRQVR